MKLRFLEASQYRSLKSIRLALGDVEVFVGANGAGKTNLYRALTLVRAAATGDFAREIAAEGGMAAALWSGTRQRGKPVRIALAVELVDEVNALSWRYRIEAGLKPPAAAGFDFEPQIKEETLTLDAGRPVTVMKREGPTLSYRDGEGRMTTHPGQLLFSETGLPIAAGAGGEAATVTGQLASWRFYHGFRSDPLSPLRAPCLAVTAPMLDMDGGNLAAVFATLAHIRQDTVELDRAVDEAFGGAALSVPLPEEEARFGVVFDTFPKRVFSARELSDGQIRFLALAGALTAYRLPPFIALNEPEASLHPDMLPALAGMILYASRSAQIWIVTHSQELAALLREGAGSAPKTVLRDEDGQTRIAGLGLTGEMRDDM